MKTKINVKKIVLGIGAIIAGGFIASTVLVSAYQGDPTKQGPNYDATLHDLKVDAFEAGDYAVWKDLMEQSGAHGRVMDVVTEENFNTFVEAHNAALAGDMELAASLRSELGLGNGQGGMHKYNMQEQNFVDLDGDGLCDNAGNTQQHLGMGKGRNR